MAKYTTMALIVRAAPAISIMGAPVRNSVPIGRTAENSPEANLIKESINKDQLPFNSPQVKAVDPIIILDVDYYKGFNQQQRSSQGRFLDRIILPTVPLEVEYNPEPQWNTIASIGRNAPFYNYSGSEDTLAFRIDWFSKQDNRSDVIYACKWLESMTKADGYLEDPHRVAIIWGKDGILFSNDVWVVHKATYTLSQFQKHRSMLPQQAYQEVILKKVLVNNSNILDVMDSRISHNPYQ